MGPEWGPTICISYKLPGYTNAGGPRPTVSDMSTKNLQLNVYYTHSFLKYMVFIIKIKNSIGNLSTASTRKIQITMIGISRNNHC